MKLSELPIDWEAVRKEKEDKKALLQKCPQYLGILKGKFIQTLSDLPESAKNSLRQQGTIWRKDEIEFRGTELVVQADGRVTDSHGLMPLLTDGVSQHCRVIAGNATKNDVRQRWSKVYEILAGGEK